MEQIALMLYGDGDLVMIACRVVVYVFFCEMFAYIISFLGSAIRCSKQ